MNADSYLLLNTILDVTPCVDSGLTGTIDTTPFALHAVAQQCYYVIHMVSLLRSLLFDDDSTYSVVVQRLAEQASLLKEVKIGKVVLFASEEAAAMATNRSTPSQGFSRLITSPSIITIAAAAAAQSGSGACEQQQQMNLPLLDNEEASGPGTSMSTVSKVDGLIVKPRKVVYSQQAAVACLPQVRPASSLDMRVTIIGGGTVARRLVRVLLDDYPTLIHPSRIGIVTRQPELLNAFASRGVRCVTRLHGYPLINECNVLVLAVQPAQVADVIREQFAARQRRPGEGELYPPAKLKITTVVVSCVAALPRAKLAAMLNHDEHLIVRASVTSTHSVLPGVAHEHRSKTLACTKLQVQRMADYDSFLREAVKEAEAGLVRERAEAIIKERMASAEATETYMPEDLAHRTAMVAAEGTVTKRHLPPPLPDVIIAEVPPCDTFLCDVFLAMQLYATNEMRKHTAPSVAAAAAAATSSAKPGAGRNKSATDKERNRKAKKSTSVVTSAEETAATEGPLLSTAFAALPSRTHSGIAFTTLYRHGAASTINIPTGVSPTPHPDSARSATGVNSARNHRHRTPGSVGEVVGLILKKFPRVYKDEAVLLADLHQRYVEVLSARKGAKG